MLLGLVQVTPVVMASDDDGVGDDDTNMAVNNTDVDDSVFGTGNVLSPASVSPSAEKMRELVNAGILTRIELDLAYASEKLLNLDMLLMDVGAKASDCDAPSLLSDDGVALEAMERLSELDLLSAILDAEVEEMDCFISSVQMDAVDAREKVSYCTNLEESFLELEEKLHGAEESLRKLQDQVHEIRTQCAEFRCTITFSLQEGCKLVKCRTRLITLFFFLGHFKNIHFC